MRKIEAARRRIDAETASSGREIRLEVDGGIKADNIRRVADAGADTFVAGSAIFGQPDYRTVIDAMRAELRARALIAALEYRNHFPRLVMPLSRRQTLTQYLIDQRRRFPQASGELNALILDVSIACKAIARAVAFGELGDAAGTLRAATSTCRARCRRSSTW